MDFRTLFRGEKAIIGMVHLLPLPGSPGWGGDLEAVYDLAARDLESLTLGGANAAIVENFHDTPFSTQITPAAIHAMAILLDRLKKTADIRLGVNVHYNGVQSEWDLAYLTGCSFLRVETFVENRMGPQGFCAPSAPELMRQKAAFPCEAMIFADMNVKHTFPLVDQPLAFSVGTAIENGADALILTGLKTGCVPQLSDVAEVRKLAGDFPLLIGSGISEATIADYLKIADGVIVGSSIKFDGDVNKPVDPNRVKRLVSSAKQ